MPALTRGADHDAPVAGMIDRLQNHTDATASDSAFVELRQTLRTASPETVSAAQVGLCQALRTCADPGAVRRIALVLSAAPSEDAIVVLAQRLDVNPPPAMSLALCDGLHAVADQRPSLAPATVALALERLERVARNARLPGALVDSAIMATAAFGSAGFDQLIKLKLDAAAPAKIHNVMYTALGETGDPRAIEVLCAAIQDTSTRDSRRAQAMYGLGQLFARADAAGRTIDPTERAVCVSILKTYLHDAAPDRVFASALKATARMVDAQQDVELRQATLAALTSASNIRREAALDVLYRCSTPIDAVFLMAVQEAARSDVDPSVRSTAAAVLDKEQAFQPLSASDAQ